MKILEYADFTPPRNNPQYDKVRQAIERDDFRAAQVKKLVNLSHGKFYRAKLDYADRLLFSTVRYQGEVYALLLEVIDNHAYDKSRFLRGVAIDEAPWNYPVKVHTYEEYENDFREKMIKAGIPVEKE